MAGRWENQSEVIWQEMKGKEEQKQKSEVYSVIMLILTLLARLYECRGRAIALPSALAVTASASTKCLNKILP